MTTTEPSALATARPGKPDRESFLPVMRQDWRDLLFLHWPVGREALAAQVPAPLEIDTRDGTAWIGLVPFRVERVRAPGLPPLPLVSTFGEVNVRTYVRAPDGEPGIWFFSLDADSSLAVQGARLLYRLPYFTADVAVERRQGEATVRYSSARSDGGATSRGVWRPAPGSATPSPRGSLEEFLIERYVLFSEGEGRLYRARVLHEDYPLVGATLLELEDELVRAAGFTVSGEPLVHASPGVDVKVSPPEPLDG